MRYALVLVCLAIALPVQAKHRAVEDFESLSMVLETNQTDGDAEVVILAKTEESGLERLTIYGPSGHRVFRSRSADRGDLGIREFALETAEPGLTEVTDAYPAGTYWFLGRSMNGNRVSGRTELSHDLPVAPGFSPNGEQVDANQPVTISWEDVGAESYIVVVENDDLGFVSETRVPGSTTSLTLAPGVLAEGTEFEIGLGTVNAAGNVAFVEGDFSTAGDTAE